MRFSDANIFLRVFIKKLLPALRARRDGMRRTCPRSSFIHCRGVRAVFLLHRAFLNTAAMNDNADFLLFKMLSRSFWCNGRLICPLCF
jgi:hypothetical protein